MLISDFQKYERNVLFSSSLMSVQYKEMFSFVLKSVSSAEEHILNLELGLSLEDIVNSESEVKTKLFSEFVYRYVALSVFICNGQNFLEDREKNINLLVTKLKALDFNLSLLLFQKSLSLYNLDNKSFVHAMPEFSRTSFAQNIIALCKQGFNLNSFPITGIKGIENVPLSDNQIFFLSYMYNNERFNDRKYLRSLFRYVGSFLSSKEAKKDQDAELNEEAQQIISRNTKLEAKFGFVTKQSLIQDIDNYNSGNYDLHDQIAIQADKEDFIIWAIDKIESIENYNKSSDKYNFKNDVIPIPSDTELLNEYIKQYSTASWLLKEYEKDSSWMKQMRKP